jgi:hypothetical protein
MSFLRFSKPRDEDQPGSRGLTSLAVVVVILLLVTVNAITRLPMFIMSFFIPVQHPIVYSFPKYAQLLPQIVKGDFVDYQSLKKSKLLDEAVSDLGHTSPDSLEDADQRFCFWLNSYNLLVLKAITDKYPIERLTDPKLSHMGTNKYFVGGKPCSIEEIRKLQLIPRISAQEPKALFLACGGCIGSPPLLNHVILPKTLKEDSESAAAKFVDKKENAHYDAIHKTFILSAFFMYNDPVFSRFGGPHVFVNNLLPKDKQLDIQSRDVLFQTYAQRLNTYLNDTALQHAKEPGKSASSGTSDQPATPITSTAPTTSTDTTTTTTTPGATIAPAQTTIAPAATAAPTAAPLPTPTPASQPSETTKPASK